MKQTLNILTVLHYFDDAADKNYNDAFKSVTYIMPSASLNPDTTHLKWCFVIKTEHSVSTERNNCSYGPQS